MKGIVSEFLIILVAIAFVNAVDVVKTEPHGADVIKITSPQCEADLIGSSPRPEEMVNCRACRNKTCSVVMLPL